MVKQVSYQNVVYDVLDSVRGKMNRERLGLHEDVLAGGRRAPSRRRLNGSDELLQKRFAGAGLDFGAY